MNKNQWIYNMLSILENAYCAKCIMQHTREQSIDHYLEMKDGKIALHSIQTFEDQIDGNTVFQSMEILLNHLLKVIPTRRRFLFIDQDFGHKMIEHFKANNQEIPIAFSNHLAEQKYIKT